MRVIIKISGEALKGEQAITGIMLEKILNDIKLLKEKKCEIIIVTGGGNFWRGRNNLDITSTTSDQIGMMATMMNALAINDYLNKNGVLSNTFSALGVYGVIKEYNQTEVLKCLANGSVVVLGGGLGIPNFSTDMVVVQKAISLDVDMIIMAKNIDGIYDRDPKEKGAIKKEFITHEELLENQIKVGVNKQGVMDFEALASLAKCKIPLYLYNAKDEEGLKSILDGKNKGTTVISE